MQASGNAALFLADALMRRAAGNKQSRAQNAMLEREDAFRAQQQNNWLTGQQSAQANADRQYGMQQQEFDAAQAARAQELSASGMVGDSFAPAAPTFDKPSFSTAFDKPQGSIGIGTQKLAQALGAPSLNVGNLDKPMVAVQGGYNPDRDVGLQRNLREIEARTAADQTLTPYQREQIRLDEARLGETTRSNRASEGIARLSATTRADVAAGKTGKPDELDQSLAMLETLSQNPSASGDVAFGYAFMKLLDPNSVVREGELQILSNATDLGTRLKNAVSRAKTGQQLTPEQRADYLNQARAIVAARKAVRDGGVTQAPQGGGRASGAGVGGRAGGAGNGSLRQQIENDPDLTPQERADLIRRMGG